MSTTLHRQRLLFWTTVAISLAGVAGLTRLSLLLRDDAESQISLLRARIDHLDAHLLDASTENRDLAIEVDRLVNSDRYAYEELAGIATDSFSGLASAYQEFLERFPKSEYQGPAKAKLKEILAVIKEQDEAEQRAIKAAKAEPDPEKALAILDQAQGPENSIEFNEIYAQYAARAHEKVAIRKAEESLGIRLSDVQGEWTRSRYSSLELPKITFKVTNVGRIAIRRLKLFAQFINVNSKETLGDEAVAYVTSELPFEPGQVRPVFMTNSVGFKYGWAAQPKLEVRIYGSDSDLGEPVLLRTKTMDYFPPND